MKRALILVLLIGCGGDDSGDEAGSCESVTSRSGCETATLAYCETLVFCCDYEWSPGCPTGGTTQELIDACASNDFCASCTGSVCSDTVDQCVMGMYAIDCQAMHAATTTDFIPEVCGEPLCNE